MRERKEVFISYSHRDAKWLRRLRVHLRPLEREHHVEVWDDTRIAAGSRWQEEVSDSIGSAKIAVLLVSADFLASEFIATDELPSLLRAAERDGVTVLPVVVSPSRFSKSRLSQFRAVNDPAKPLIKMSKGEQETVLVELTEIIETLLKAPSEVAVRQLHDELGGGGGEVRVIEKPVDANNTRAAVKPLAPDEVTLMEKRADTNLTPGVEQPPPAPVGMTAVTRGFGVLSWDDTREFGRIGCAFCGTRISDEDEFCPPCGARQPRAYKREQPSVVRAKLVVANTTEPDASFTVEKESTLIGRQSRSEDAPLDIDLSKYDQERTVSRLHAKIWRKGELFFIEDLESTNGTVINDIFRMAPRQPRLLKFGDKLRLGATILYFIY